MFNRRVHIRTLEISTAQRLQMAIPPSFGSSQSSSTQRPSASKRQIAESDDDGLTSKKRRTNSRGDSDEENSDDGEIGGLSDHDERDGDERRFAEQSPYKGRKRLNSQVRATFELNILIPNEIQALVKVENTDECEKVPRSRVTNKHLPEQLTINDRWTKKILPTLFRWFAAQANPWSPVAEDLEASLQLIGSHFAGDDYILAKGVTSPEFQLVCPPLYQYLITNNNT